MYDYNFLDKQLNALISSMIDSLSQDEISELRELLDAGEYGVAYETLCSIIVERNKLITKQMYAQLIELGQKMQMTEDTWLKLQHYVAQE
jgi:plasmid maintenance system antidote protein VapI